VVEFYDRGGEANENLDPLIKPLGLSDGEINALVEFLRALTGDNVETLVLDAYAAPVGDIQ
jgi:cytochrome c peroxidase